jgi:hypothetical protein
MFTPIIMPLEVYDELNNVFIMPLHFPKPPSATRIVDLYYMPFEDAILHPFIDEHQPSLQNRRRVNNSHIGGVVLGNREKRSPELDPNKLTQGKLVHGVVTCKNCMTPKVLYSVTAPNLMKPPATIGDADPTARLIRLCREYAI